MIGEVIPGNSRRDTLSCPSCGQRRHSPSGGLWEPLEDHLRRGPPGGVYTIPPPLLEGRSRPPLTLLDFLPYLCHHIVRKVVRIHFLASCLPWSVGSMAEAGLIPCGVCTVLGAPWRWTGWMTCFSSTWLGNWRVQGGGCL